VTEAEVRPGQFWRAKDPTRLRSTSQIRILRVDKMAMCRIERYYTVGNKPRHKKDWITVAGLRKHYTLFHDQETLL